VKTECLGPCLEWPVTYRFGDFEVSTSTYELSRAGQRIHLEPRVFEVLAYLLAHRRRVVSKEELLEKLWAGQTVSDSALTRTVRDARRALGDTGAKERWIQTLYGRGFRFAGEVAESGSPSSDTPVTVAVLPFAALGAEAEEAVFARGITEDVIAQLAKVRSLKVISLTSSRLQPPVEQALRELRRRFGASAALRGSVRRAGDRVRVVAEVLSTESTEHLWAETYDRRLTDIFEIQADLALRIGAALRAELTPDERRRIGRQPTRDLAAYQLYLRGRFSLSRYTGEGVRQAIREFERAIAIDAHFALAHAGLARAYAEVVSEGVDPLTPAAAYDIAMEAARRALALDQDLGEAHAVVGLLMFTRDFDWRGAEREFQRALELSPGCADVYDYYGWMCQAQERNDDAIRLLRTARELDPLAHPTDFGAILLRAGHYAEALQAATEAIEYDPGIARGHSLLGWALLRTGRTAEGLEALERAVALSPESTLFLGQLGQAYAVAGRTEDARRALARMHEVAHRRYVSPYHFAYVHTGLGENDLAIDWLERAVHDRVPGVHGVKGSFLFQSLRDEPRFLALLRSMNLDS
jgi:TolB-like protein/Tfp pilus assembly protein PilF